MTHYCAAYGCTRAAISVVDVDYSPFADTDRRRWTQARVWLCAEHEHQIAVGDAVRIGDQKEYSNQGA